MESSVIKAVGFVHLHVHSAFSLREGALAIETLAKLAKADAMPALAITDTNNLFGALEFSEKLAKAGVQPIVGCLLSVDLDETATAPGVMDFPACFLDLLTLPGENTMQHALGDLDRG